jgi:hypothetical protein
MGYLAGKITIGKQKVPGSAVLNFVNNILDGTVTVALAKIEAF